MDGLPFVSLELLEGGSLADRLEGTPQPAGPTTELLLTLASAIQVAHDAGIVHRDLKPSNVLFTADGTPIISDFGLAKRIDSDSRQTETGQIMGSPSYMAPSRPGGTPAISGRPRTSIPWARSSTRCSPVALPSRGRRRWRRFAR